MSTVTPYFVKDLLPNLPRLSYTYFTPHRMIECKNKYNHINFVFCYAHVSYRIMRAAVGSYILSCMVLPGWEDFNTSVDSRSPGTYRNKFSLLVYNRACVYSQKHVFIYVNKLYLHAGK